MIHPKKVFLGFTDIASTITDLCEGFNALGIETLSAVRQTHIIQDCKVDYPIDKIVLERTRSYEEEGKRLSTSEIEKSVIKEIWDKALLECDLYIFFWDSFTPDFSDFITLKNAGKKIAVAHVGSDIRYLPAMVQEFRYYGLPDPKPQSWNRNRPLGQCLHTLRMAEKYADLRLSGPPTSQLALRPYYRMPFAIGTKELPHRPAQREIPVIAHAPSHRAIKGTDTILRTLDELKAEGIKHEVDIIEGVGHTEAMQRYADADIVISQLYLPGGGRLAFEALATGTLSLSHMSENTYPLGYPAGCPVIDINEGTLKSVLRDWIPYKEKRTQHALRGRKFIEDHFLPKNACETILSALNAGDEAATFFPSYYRHNYIPSDKKEIGILTKSNQFVSDEKWYSKFVAKGFRDGINF